MRPRFNASSIFAFIICCMLMFSFTSDGRAQLYAGAARIDITPTEPVELAGYAARKGLSQGVHDRLYARAILFKQEQEKVLLVSTDLIGFYGGTDDYIREAILQKFKLTPSQLFLCAVHTHSGPSLTADQEKSATANYKYTKQLREKLIELVQEAGKSLRPVLVGTGKGSSPVGVNRREVRLDDTNWPKEEFIKLGRNPDEPTDKEVLLMKVVDPDSLPYAVVFDYASHGTSLGGKNYIISGDIFGLAEQFVENIFGNNQIALAFAGASGDIDPWFRVLPAFNEEPGWIPEPVLLATLLGEEVVHVARNIHEYDGKVSIMSAIATVDLPGKEKGAFHSNQKYAARPLRITAARVGDIGFIGLGGEVLTEIGTAIKAGSPFKDTFIITHCNGAAGYLVPAHLFTQGGYEVNTSRFAPGAAEIVIKKSLQMLYGLK